MTVQKTFVDLLRALEHADPSRGILLMDSRARETFHSWPDLFRRIRAQARRFQADGIRPGTRVLIPFETSVDAIASFLGLVLLGAVPMSVSAPLIGQDRDAHRRQMLTIVRRFRVDRLLESDELAGLAGSVPEAPASLSLSALSAEPEELADTSPVGVETVDPDAIAFVQFSSGSTARPKGVPVTHRALLYNLGLIVANDRRSERSVMVSWLPLYHDMGLVGCLLSNFIHHNALVLMHPRCFMTRPISWLAAVSRHRGTVTAVPNFALDVCSERIPDEQLSAEPLDLSSFRYIYNGSEPVRPASIRRFEERFRPFGFVPGSIYPVYGMAEATLIVSAPPFGQPGAAFEREGREIPSVGHLLGDFQVCILDETGRPVPSGATGEIHLRGTSILRGYLDGTSNDLLHDGWLATGDLGLLDAAGRLYITGRRKDLLIVRGRNFYTHDIAAHVERTLSLRSGSAYVFSVNKADGEAVVVMVSASKRGASRPESMAPVDSGNNGLSTEIRRAVQQEFGLAVHDTCLVQKIPRTSSGKVMRHACEQMYLESRAS